MVSIILQALYVHIEAQHHKPSKSLLASSVLVLDIQMPLAGSFQHLLSREHLKSYTTSLPLDKRRIITAHC